EEGVLKLSIEDVKRVKHALIQHGCSFKNAEGKWDSEMKDAVAKFQKEAGLKETKKLDVATLNALGFSAVVGIAPDVRGAELTIGRSPIGPERPAGMPIDATVVGGGKDVIGYLILGKDQLKRIQDRLKEDGYFRGEPSGAVTQEFMNGIKLFQQAKGF